MEVLVDVGKVEVRFRFPGEPADVGDDIMYVVCVLINSLLVDEERGGL